MRRPLLLLALMTAAALPAQAGRIEDAFRGFLERLRGGAPVADVLRERWAQPEVRVPELASRVETLPLGQHDYAVFVAPGCRGCEQALAYLRERKLAFEVLDVTRSATAREAYQLTGAQGLPVVLVGKQRITGWSERLFKEALRNQAQDALLQAQGDGA